MRSAPTAPSHVISVSYSTRKGHDFRWAVMACDLVGRTGFEPVTWSSTWLSGGARDDDVFRAGRLPAVVSDRVEGERARERYLRCVAAGERSREPGSDLVTQLRYARQAGLLQERRQQPPADAPGHAIAAGQLGRAAVKRSVDVDLLVHGRPVPAVAARGGASGGFHARQDLARQPAAADGVEGKRGTGCLKRAGQLGHEAGGRRIADVDG